MACRNALSSLRGYSLFWVLTLLASNVSSYNTVLIFSNLYYFDSAYFILDFIFDSTLRRKVLKVRLLTEMVRGQFHLMSLKLQILMKIIIFKRFI